MRLIARPGGALRGKVRPPGDKSISHRALLLGALAEGETRISGLLESADVLCTARAMAAFGAEVQADGPGAWRVQGRRAWREPAAPVDFGNSGTGVRLTMGALGGRAATAVFVGDDSLSERPMARVLEPLGRMGVKSLARAKGRLPAAVQGVHEPAPITHEGSVASAQVKSAVLLCGLAADGETAVIEPAPSRDHTERMLAAFGVSVVQGHTEDGRWRAALRGPARLAGRPVAVPGDPSSAAFAAAAAAILPGSDLHLDGVLLNPSRTGFFACLQAMGGNLAIEAHPSDAEPVGSLRVRHAAGLRGAAPDPAAVASFIDEVPILAVLAAFAEGETRITGAEDLRHKESDRIAMTVAGLRACGVEAEDLPDGLIVRGAGFGGVRGGAEIQTHGDHRIAMAFLVLGLAARTPVIVDRADMIATSFPDFAGFMAGLGADIAAID